MNANSTETTYGSFRYEKFVKWPIIRAVNFSRINFLKMLLFPQQSVLPSLVELSAVGIVPPRVQQPAVAVLPPPLQIRSPRLFRPLHYLPHLPSMEWLAILETKDHQAWWEVKDPQGQLVLQDPRDHPDHPDPRHHPVPHLHAALFPLRESKQDRTIPTSKLVFTYFA